jgi:hypothetical protein
MVWIIAGAVLGGLIVGSFGFQPAWLWGMAGGAAGGLLGAAAGSLAGRPWKLPVRILVISLVLFVGFFSLWMLASSKFLIDWVMETQRLGTTPR